MPRHHSNRLTDDQSQLRIRSEAEAIEAILRRVREDLAVWVSSTVLETEIRRNPDLERRRDVAALLVFADEVVAPHAATGERALALEKLGFGMFDALHLATAEQAHVDVFLTTDDDLARLARRHSELLLVRVKNPLSWYEETP